MKKPILTVASVFALGSTTVLGLSDNVIGSNTAQKQLHFLDWNLIDEYVQKSFADLQKSEVKVNKMSTQSTAKDINSPEVLAFAQAKITEFTDHFKQQNATVSEMFTFYETAVPNFNETFKDEFDKIVNRNLIVTSELQVSVSKLNSYENRQKLQELKKARAIALTVAAAASVIAAGLWAAAWWFGLTIPGAIIFSAISAIALYIENIIAGGIDDVESSSAKEIDIRASFVKTNAFRSLKSQIKKLNRYGGIFLPILALVDIVEAVLAWEDL